MAEIVLGLGTSHSPMLSTPSEMWHLHRDRDQKNPQLHFRGRIFNFTELKEARASEQLEQHLSDEIWRYKEQACRQAITTIGDKLARIAPDVVLIIGDDQHELFLDDNMPAISIFWGDRIECVPPRDNKGHPSIVQARRDQFGEEREWYPGESELGQHLLEQMTAMEFDVAQFYRQPEGRSIGHAFTFVRRRIMREKLFPIVPVMLNTYYPPNQPTAARCYAFGQALRRAIESWDSAKKIAIIASGGLSHFVVDEDLDHEVLEAMRKKDGQSLGRLGQDLLQSGSSEIKNWIVAAGALESLQMNLVSYSAAYRSEAGTGCGLAFAEWH